MTLIKTWNRKSKRLMKRAERLKVANLHQACDGDTSV